MQDTLIDQGLSLMIYGMGTVFVFLTILVFATGLMSKLVNKYSPTPVAISSDPQKLAQSTSSVTSGADIQVSPQVLEAIKQAIGQHRQR